MHTNTYAATGDHVIDSSGKAWATEQAHPIPIPDGITADCVSGDKLYGTGCLSGACGLGSWTHWLVRRPLPAPPRVKTQAEMDSEAYFEWERDHVPLSVRHHPEFVQLAWLAALAYARK